MKLTCTMTRSAFRHRFCCIWRFLWVLPIVCLMIASCSTPSPLPVTSTTQQCGTIQPSSEGTASARSSGSCFWQAFQHCRAASLTYIDESSNEYTFTTELNASRCQVVESVHLTKGLIKSSTSTCSKLEGFRGGHGALILSGCTSNGNITVPVDPAIQ